MRAGTPVRGTAHPLTPACRMLRSATLRRRRRRRRRRGYGGAPPLVSALLRGVPLRPGCESRSGAPPSPTTTTTTASGGTYAVGVPPPHPTASSGVGQAGLCNRVAGLGSAPGLLAVKVEPIWRPGVSVRPDGRYTVNGRSHGAPVASYGRSGSSRPTKAPTNEPLWRSL